MPEIPFTVGILIMTGRPDLARLAKKEIDVRGKLTLDTRALVLEATAYVRRGKGHQLLEEESQELDELIKKATPSPN